MQIHRLAAPLIAFLAASNSWAMPVKAFNKALVSRSTKAQQYYHYGEGPAASYVISARRYRPPQLVQVGKHQLLVQHSSRLKKGNKRETPYTIVLGVVQRYAGKLRYKIAPGPDKTPFSVVKPIKNDPRVRAEVINQLKAEGLPTRQVLFSRE